MFWLVALACVFVACWLAWLDKHRELLRERKRHQPCIKGEVLQTILGKTDGDNSTWLLIFLELRNTGEMPSIVDGWRVSVSLANGPDYSGTLQHAPKMNLQMLGGRMLRLDSTDAIYQKVELVPIGFGGKATGWLAALVADPESVLASQGTKVTVFFSDVLGNETNAEHVLGRVQPDARYFPGITIG